MIFPRQKIYDFDGVKILKNNLKNFDIKNLEKKFIEELKIKKKYNIYFTSKGRTALFLIIKYLIKKTNKTEFIISPFTIFDIVNMIIIAGGKPIFVDFKKNSFDIDEKKLSLSISQNTCAIIACHYSLNQDLEYIRKICKEHDLDLIQDCAIAMTSRKNNESILNQSSFSFISFNIFKFLPSIYGGAIITDNKLFKEFFYKETKEWKIYKFKDLIIYYLKSLKFRILTSSLIFNFFIFWIIKLGERFKINIITENTKNDPNPILRKNFDFNLKKKINNNQYQNLEKHLEVVEKLRLVRVNNYKIFNSKIINKKLTKIVCNTNIGDASCLNFPLISDDKEKFSKYLFNQNIDHSKYFYRNCSNLEIFKKYAVNCENIEELEKKIIFFPTHHEVTSKQINNIINAINNY